VRSNPLNGRCSPVGLGASSDGDCNDVRSARERVWARGGGGTRVDAVVYTLSPLGGQFSPIYEQSIRCNHLTLCARGRGRCEIINDRYRAHNLT